MMVQNRRMARVLIFKREGVTEGRVDLVKVRSQSVSLDVLVDLQIW